MPHWTRSVEPTPEIDAWREKSPLRKWLAKRAHKGGVALLQSKYGVSRAAVYAWASGLNLPASRTFADLCKTIRVSPTAYMEWWDSFPGDSQCQVQLASDSTPASS